MTPVAISGPEARLAALVTNPAAWVDGKLPRLPKAKTGNQNPDGSEGPTGGGQDDASGAASASGDGDTSTTRQAAAAAKKTAAKKAASTPARGRAAAGEGDSGA